MSDPITRIEEIALDLVGCCGGSRPDLEQELDELGVAHDAKASAAFDEIVFMCDGCGWYCGVDELNNDSQDQLCDECNESRQDDT